ncbi:hypothetical protein [Bacillus sp. FSL R12-0069]|uniref:hypothetical protein n=1 Tax=Bacillus sp. FSL R12-0069 TaxID=2975342 RepID=UPI0030F72A26
MRNLFNVPVFLDQVKAFLDKLWEVRKSKEDSQKMSMYPIEEELLLYMDEAFRIYDEKTCGSMSTEKQKNF